MNEKHRQLVTFKIGPGEAAIPIQEVREIIRPDSFTPIPHAPRFFAGMSNLRGEILPIMNLRERMGLATQAMTQECRVIVIQSKESFLGILVDKVNEVIDLGQSPDAGYHSQDHKSDGLVESLFRIPESSRVVMLINTQNLVPPAAEKNPTRQARTSRSGSVSAKETDSIHHEGTEEFVSFRIQEQLFAIPLGFVKEIIKETTIHPVLSDDSSMAGAITLRDVVIPVFSLHEVLKTRNAQAACSIRSSQRRIIVLELREQTLGIIVDSVYRMLKVSEKDILPPPDMKMSEKREHFVKGLYHLDPANIILLLDPLLLNLTVSKSMESKTKENKDLSAQGKSSQEVQIVCFKLGNQEYGITIDAVQEIIRVNAITSVPRSFDYIEGIINLRGTVIPVIDFRAIVGSEKRSHDDRSRIVVIHHHDKIYGIVVDNVTEVLRTSSESIKDSPEGLSPDNASFIKKICKQEQSNRIISILEVDDILPKEAKAS